MVIKSFLLLGLTAEYTVENRRTLLRIMQTMRLMTEAVTEMISLACVLAVLFCMP